MKIENVGLHEWRVCLDKELVQWDYLDKEVVTKLMENVNTKLDYQGEKRL